MAFSLYPYDSILPLELNHRENTRQTLVEEYSRKPLTTVFLNCQGHRQQRLFEKMSEESEET